MLTQDEINLMYGKDDWGVYKYNARSKSLINELLKFSSTHSLKDVRLSFWAHENDHDRNDKLFDLGNLTIYLYYRERASEIYNEIVNNDILEQDWYDTDSYTLNNEESERIRKDTTATKRLLKRILKLNTEFDKLVFPKNNQE